MVCKQALVILYFVHLYVKQLIIKIITVFLDYDITVIISVRSSVRSCYTVVHFIIL